MVEHRGLVLFGSQTGTAQEIAEGLWRQLKWRNISGPVLAMDDYDPRNLINEKVVIFVCSTTGDGEEPDNMKRFWRFMLRKSLPPNSLVGLNFAVLGLGDSTYSKFNFPAKKLHKRLLQLGAAAIVDVGLCDYQHDLGHDAIAEPWTAKLWVALKEIYPFINVDRLKDSVTFIPRWHVTKSAILNTNNEGIYLPNEIDDSFLLKLQNNNRITSESHFQDVRLLEFNSIDKNIKYKPGDVLYVRPKNSPEMIERFFKIFENHKLNLKPEDQVTVNQLYDDLPIPNAMLKPVTMFNLVEQYWDLSAIPKKYAFSVLGYFSEHELEKNKCIEFCTPEGQEELFNYCNRPRRHILEVLEDFHQSTASLTLQSLFEIFICIKPRPFSIASSSQASNGKQIDLLVAVVKYYTKLKSERLGLCSNWLKHLKIGECVVAWIKSGTFKFPQEKDIPVIMIGPGTGLAPFRNYIMEKEYNNEASKDTLILFFGCRNEKSDFHCGKQLKQLQESSKLTLICAFSRDQENKIYVQHKIEEQKSFLWKWLSEKKAQIYIAGSSKDMPDGVKSSLIDNVLVKEGMMIREDAETFLKEMERTGRLQLETW